VAAPAMPRILSPNLGCPEITSLETLENAGASIVVASPQGNRDWTQYQLRAKPSYVGEGRAFSLVLFEPEVLVGEELPQSIRDVSNTRLLISHTLRSSLFRNRAVFWKFRIRASEKMGSHHLRETQGGLRPTLYDLALCQDGGALHEVKHSLCLRPPSPEVRFIHLTDLHVAARNDLWEGEVNSTVNPDRADRSPLEFINFNERLRLFIREANALSDAGKLDFVLALGDLVDFVRFGFRKAGPLENNWRVLLDIFTGGGEEANRGNPGLRVPIFTTLGNHDWRAYPYPPEINSKIFGLRPEDAQKLDYLYADSSEEVGAKLAKVHAKLVSEGSPILARSWWGSAVGIGMRWLTVAWDRVSIRSLALASRYFQTLLGTLLVALGGSGVAWHESVRAHLGPLASVLPSNTTLSVLVILAVVFLLGLLLFHVLGDWVECKLREKITSLIAIESSVRGLRDYFLNLNPYFNYALRLENCYFLILDTGHDALTAQSFWDNGGKKLQHLKVRDNIIGGSPETIAFFPPNEYYPYSQIAWLELVLDCIHRSHDQLAGGERRCRVFVGLHAPPANLSSKDRTKVDSLLHQQQGPILLRRGWPFGFDIRYGTLNHYLSEFFYLCLGYRQSTLASPSGPGVDVVLAGHVHWNIEFRLDKPAHAGAATWKPQVYYGEFSPEIEHNHAPPNRWWGTLLLQTAACGPPSDTQRHTPNFRYIIVTPALAVPTLRPRHLMFAPGRTTRAETPTARVGDSRQKSAQPKG
jgi:calcineurin-like phosphoesterase family protein